MNTPQSPTSAASLASAQLQGLILAEAKFRRLRRAPEPNEPADIKFNLQLHRPDARSLQTRIGMTVNVPDALESELVFVASFGTQHEATDEYWREVAARLAPVVVFPFMRETFASLSARAGLPLLLLPIIHVGNLWKPDAVELPPVQDEPAQTNTPS